MSALAKLHQAGLTAVAIGDDVVRVKGPAPTIAAWRAFIVANKPQLLAELLPTRAVVEYRLSDSKGGTLIDPAGAVSAVRELHWRYGVRVDWPALLAMFEAREQDADREAADLIQRPMADDFRAARGE